MVTKNGYKNEVKKMKNYAPFKSISFAELTKKDIEHYLEYLFIIEKLAPSTIAKIRVVLGSLYKVAIQRELVEYNLIYKTEPIKVKKAKRKALSKEKAKIFLEALENSEYKLEFYLLIFLGLRKSELLGIMIDNINFEEKSLCLEQSLIWDSENKIYVVNREMKSPLAHRKFPLIPILTDFLTERIDRIKEDKIFFGNTYGIDKKLNFNAEGYLCIDREGKILRKFKLNYELDKILKNIELEHLSIHELRHTCATLMYSEGVDLKKIQYWLGHSNISTTANIYAHYDNSKNFEVIGKLEKALTKKID
ncbi:tyrosine-type recombinase/integrase [Fusobacterium nucleatum]